MIGDVAGHALLGKDHGTVEVLGGHTGHADAAGLDGEDLVDAAVAEQAEKLRDIGNPTLTKVADFIEHSVLPALRTKATFKMPTCSDFGVPDGAITIAADDLPEGATVPPLVEVGDMDF